MKRLLLLILLGFSGLTLIDAQNSSRFQKEIDSINRQFSGKTVNRDLIIFTGSSSVRRWQKLSDYFPGKNIINTGFGGSQMSDLLFYSNIIIQQFKPAKVFIYEGDNDIAAGKKSETIIKDAEMLCRKLISQNPGIRIIFMSAKPSPLRWNLREEYLKLNSAFADLHKEFKRVKYIDLWSPLLNKQGRPVSELYMSDSLHINKKGYEIWAKKIVPLLK